MISNDDPISSVEQLLQYFEQTSKTLFYIGRMYCNSKLRMHDFMPKYEIITCFDPFYTRFPFIKVPDTIKNAQIPHQCTDITKCLLTVLQDPQVIAYIKNKDQNANLILVHIDQQSQKICKQNSFRIWGPSTQTQNWLNNKVEIVGLLKQLSIPFIPNVCAEVHSYEQLLALALPFGTDKIVVQCEDGGSGFGTHFIFGKEDYQRAAQQLQDGRPKKVMPFKRLRSFGVGVVAGRFGTALGPMHCELIGHRKLTQNLGGFCGNELREDYFEDEEVERRVRGEIYAIAERFGDHLYGKGIYKGYFGIDFVVDMDTKTTYFMEMNPRQTACTTLSYQYYQADGRQFPLFLLSCAQHLGLNLKLNIKAFNQYWEQPSSYNVAACHIPFKHMEEKEMITLSNAPNGIWVIEEGKPKFTGKFTFIINEMAEQQIFFLPMKGFAKGHLILKKKCFEYDGCLKKQVEEIVQMFLALLKQTSKYI